MAQLASNTIWGALRGIETFSQLVTSSTSGSQIVYKVAYAPISVEDKPRFPCTASKSGSINTQSDIKKIVEHAYYRGIPLRVVPEIDMPGHTASWSLGYPELIVKCPPDMLEVTSWHWTLDPSKQLMYDVIEANISEMRAIFPDEFFHLGGDEIRLEC